MFLPLLYAYLQTLSKRQRLFAVGSWLNWLALLFF